MSLPRLAGGGSARRHPSLLDKYGMRRVGEDRHHEACVERTPTTLVPMILSKIKNFEPGAAKRRFEQGRQEA